MAKVILIGFGSLEQPWSRSGLLYKSAVSSPLARKIGNMISYTGPWLRTAGEGTRITRGNDNLEPRVEAAGEGSQRASARAPCRSQTRGVDLRTAGKIVERPIASQMK